MNTMLSLTLLLGVVSQLHTAPQYAAPQYAAAEYPDERPLYRYEYSVNDDENGALTFNAVENRDGTDASGSYSVLLPDSRIQTVTYTVDPVNGFLAEVTYSGEARFDPVPVYKPAASYSTAPIYSAAPSYPAAPSYSAARTYSAAPSYTFGSSNSVRSSYSAASANNAAPTYLAASSNLAASVYKSNIAYATPESAESPTPAPEVDAPEASSSAETIAPIEASADAPVSEYPSDPTQFLENILYREN